MKVQQLSRTPLPAEAAAPTEGRRGRLGSIRAYCRLALRRDLIAGVTVASVAIPQGMAYALVAGVEPKYGLYTAIVMTMLGSLFGSSSHLINGPTNAISLLVFTALAKLGSDGEEQGPIQAVFLLAIMVGVIQIGMGLLKLGGLKRYVSEAVILGFMVGAGVLLGLGQLPNLLDLPMRGTADQHLLVRLWLTLTQDAVLNRQALGIGLATAAMALVVRRIGFYLRLQVPDLLLALVFASLAVWLFGWVGDSSSSAVHLHAVGQLPQELPPFTVPTFRMDWIQKLSGSALAIALLGLLEALAVAKSISSRTHQPIDYNRQCLAEGLANLGGGFFQCMPGSGSLTRSAINYQAGAVTCLSGMFSAAIVAGSILVLAQMAQFVTRPVLAGLLLVTAYRIVDRFRLRYYLRDASRRDILVALATMLLTVFVSLEFSIVMGVGLAFLVKPRGKGEIREETPPTQIPVNILNENPERPAKQTIPE